MVIDAGPTCPVRILVTLGKDAELPEWRIEAEMPEGWVNIHASGILHIKGNNNLITD